MMPAALVPGLIRNLCPGRAFSSGRQHLNPMAAKFQLDFHTIFAPSLPEAGLVSWHRDNVRQTPTSDPVYPDLPPAVMASLNNEYYSEQSYRSQGKSYEISEDRTGPISRLDSV